MDATVVRARGWAESLLSRVYSGPGDTVESAMFRAERKFGIDAQTFWALRYRPPRRIMADVYLRLQTAYEAECARQTARLSHEIDMTRRIAGDAADPDLLDEAEALVRAGKGASDGSAKRTGAD